MAQSYELLGPRVFHRSLKKRITSADGLIDERYDNDGLRAALDEQLGESLLSQTLTDVVLTAYDLEDRRAVFFRTWRARNGLSPMPAKNRSMPCASRPRRLVLIVYRECSSPFLKRASMSLSLILTIRTPSGVAKPIW